MIILIHKTETFAPDFELILSKALRKMNTMQNDLLLFHKSIQFVQVL
jgi:hypothetical protein